MTTLVTSMLWDCIRSNIRTGVRGLALASAIMSWAMVSQAAEPDLVGVLALALEADVAEKIGLSERSRARLLDVVDRRENEALEIVLEIRDLPFDQRAAKLAPFRAESERQGLVFLTERQRQLLRAAEVTRLGMASLAEPDVVAGLELSSTQREEIERLLDQRTQAMRGVDRNAQRLARSSYERKLSAVLSDGQRAQWDQIAEGELVAAAPRQENDERTTAPTAQAYQASGGDLAGTATGTNEKPAGGQDARLLFNFRYAPWKDVLDWFATQADLSLVSDAQPLGTFNYSDSRRYTPAEAIDVLNSVLLTKGYTLVRRDRMLILVNLEDGIPQNLVPQVPLEELEERGEYELVSCLFPLEWMTSEEAEKEISKLLGPQGSVVTLPMARQILVTETAGRLRTIRKVIESVEKRDARGGGEPTAFPLKHANVEYVIAAARQLLGLPDDLDATPDGTLRIFAGPFGSRLLASGEPRMVNRLRKLVELLDVPPVAGAGAVVEFPQVEVYSVSTADPTSVLQVVQTLLAGLPDVRVTTDPKTGNLVALARPSQHSTIRATINQMERDALQVEVIQLSLLDPQLAATSINTLFGGEGGDGILDPSAPRVDSDPTTRSLLVRGTQSQIAQIRSLLEKMGETDAEAKRIQAGRRGNVRMLPITGVGARRALEQARLIWPATRPNRIRTVTPSAAIRRIRPRPTNTIPDQPSIRVPPDGGRDEETGNGNDGSDDGGNDAIERQAIGSASLDTASVPPTITFAAQRTGMFAAQRTGRPDPADQTESATSDILVAPGPRGLMIASEDLDALDEFEGLLRTLADRVLAGQREIAVFYLKHAKAEVAAELVKQFLGVGGGDNGAGGGSLLGNLAGAALGDAGGGLLGSLLGLGGSGVAAASFSSAVNIIADSRLNALVVQASAEELDLTEQLLEVIDQDRGPEEVRTSARPRLIPVFNMRAEELAAIVREIYATRISGRGRGGPPRQPTPEEFIRAMRGGQNGRPSTREAVQEQERMALSVDSRNNSLIVLAPDPLFFEVQDLVTQLDQSTSASKETIRVVTIRRTKPESIQRALAAIIGDTARTNGDQGGRNGRGRSTERGRQIDRPDAPFRQSTTPEQIRQRIDFFNALQRAGRQGQRRPGDGERRRREPTRGPGR